MLDNFSPSDKTPYFFSQTVLIEKKVVVKYIPDDVSRREAISSLSDNTHYPSKLLMPIYIFKGTGSNLGLCLKLKMYLSEDQVHIIYSKKQDIFIMCFCYFILVLKCITSHMRCTSGVFGATNTISHSRLLRGRGVNASYEFIVHYVHA